MATTRKRTTRKPARKTTARKPIRRNAPKRKPVRKNMTKKPVRNAKKKTALTWGIAVKGHPISGRPCGGRVMSQRDQKLFTKMGKRRAGVTLKMIKEAYGNDYDKLVKAKPAARKTAPKRRTTTRKTTVKRKAPIRRKTAARKPALPPKGKAVSITGGPKSRPQKYIVVNVTSGNRYVYQSSHKLLTTARKKEAALSAANPRKRFAIVKLDTKAS